ncbi:MAG: hypothetical protein E6Y69_00930 [Clostridium botulinum]|nr:hypothetical protein [Clostridium botulinum]
MLKDNTLELHGLIGGSNKDLISNKSLYEYIDIFSVNASTMNPMLVKDKCAIGNKYALYATDQTNLIYLYKKELNSASPSQYIGSIQINGFNCGIYPMSFGFAVLYRKRDSGTVFGIRFYDNECNNIGGNDNLSVISGQYQYPIRVLEDSKSGMIYAVAYLYSQGGTMFGLNPQFELSLTRTISPTYDFPDFSFTNTVVYDQHIYGGSISDNYLVNYDILNSKVIAKVKLNINSEGRRIAIDPKFGYAFNFLTGETYELNTMSTVALGSPIITLKRDPNDSATMYNLECKNPNFKAGTAMIWGDYQGNAFEIKFSKNNINKAGNYFAPQIRVCTEIVGPNLNSNSYTLLSSVDSKNLLVNRAGKMNDENISTNYFTFRR